jgi:hypothetical protein
MVYLDRGAFPCKPRDSGGTHLFDEPSFSLKILDLGHMTVQPDCNLRLGQSYERASTDSGQKAPSRAKITTAGLRTGVRFSAEGGELPSLLIAVPGGRRSARRESTRHINLKFSTNFTAN